MKELDRCLYDLSEKGPHPTEEETFRLESMKEERDSILLVSEHLCRRV